MSKEHEEIPWSSDRLFEKNQKVFEWPLNSLGNPSTDHRADKMVQIWTDFQCWSFSSVTTNKHCRCFITLIYHNGNIMLKHTISISFCLDWGSCFCSTLLYYQAIKKAWNSLTSYKQELHSFISLQFIANFSKFSSPLNHVNFTINLAHTCVEKSLLVGFKTAWMFSRLDLFLMLFVSFHN